MPADDSQEVPEPPSPAALQRRRAAELFAANVAQADVARALGVSRQTVSRWHRAWLESGETGSRASARAGLEPG